MALTVTTAVDVGTASVRLTVTGGVPPYVADASPGGDRDDYRVRTPWATVVGDVTARVGIDGQIPLDVPTQYVITDAAGAQVTTAAVVASSSTPILSDSTDPARAVHVLVQSQKPNRWEARSVWWDVLGSSAPFASVAPMRFRNGPMVLRVVGNVERADLLRLLRPGNPLMFRGVCEDAVDDVVMLVESVDEALVLDDDPTGPALWTLSYQAISRELGPYAVNPAWSYAQVKAAYATYNVVKATYTSYDALRAGDSAAGLGPELVGANGSFSSGLTGWSTFWTFASVTWDTTSGTARATSSAAAQSAVIYPSPGVDNIVTTPGTRYRATGRVRCADPGAVVFAQLMTNTAPAAAQYFEPGVAAASAPIPFTAAWSTFTVELVVPAGDDRATFLFRVDGLGAGQVIEWDDLSIKVRT